jgi:hypothetical protein
MNGSSERSGDKPGNHAEPVTIFDIHKHANKVRLRRLPAIMARALQLVWDVARGEFLIVTALQAVGGLGLVLPILAGRNLLSALQALEAWPCQCCCARS